MPAGEIDLVSRSVWEVLRQVVGGGDVHLDLAGLRFIDARGTALLVQVASLLGNGQRKVLHHPPRCLRRVLQLLWPAGVAAIVIDGEVR